MANAEEKMFEAINGLATQISQLSNQVSTVQSTMVSLKEDINKRQTVSENNIATNTRQLKAIFKRETRKNLVIIGWSEVVGLQPYEIRLKVMELLTQKLAIPGVRSFDIDFVRVTGNSNNIIIATLCTAELVRQAIRNGSKLKGTNIFLQYDASPEERNLKKKLLTYKRNLSAKGKVCKLTRNNKALIVDSIEQTLEELEGNTSDIDMTVIETNETNNRKKFGKRQISPITSETKKKTKRVLAGHKTPRKSSVLKTSTPSKSDSYHTDSDEFESESSLQGSKNGERPPAPGEES